MGQKFKLIFFFFLSSSSSSSKSGNSSSDNDGGIESGEVEDVDGVFLRRRFCAHSANEHDDADVRLSTPVDLITGESRVASWNELVFSASESTIARTDFMVMPIFYFLMLAMSMMCLPSDRVRARWWVSVTVSADVTDGATRVTSVTSVRIAVQNLHV